MAFFGFSQSGNYSGSAAPARPQIETDVKDALARMMTAIYKGDVDTYKQIVEHEFPENLGPRMKKDYRLTLQYHLVDNAEDMSPLQLAVISGNPRMVEEVLKLGGYIEHFMTTGEWHHKTARGIADVLLNKYADKPDVVARLKEIKSLLLQHGALPKTVTTLTGTRLVFPENKVNVNMYKRSVRKSRKAKKTRKHKIRRL